MNFVCVRFVELTMLSLQDEKLRPHTCDRCGKSFAQRSVAIAHVKAVRKYTRPTSNAVAHMPSITCDFCRNRSPVMSYLSVGRLLIDDFEIGSYFDPSNLFDWQI